MLQILRKMILSHPTPISLLLIPANSGASWCPEDHWVLDSWYDQKKMFPLHLSQEASFSEHCYSLFIFSRFDFNSLHSLQLCFSSGVKMLDEASRSFGRWNHLLYFWIASFATFYLDQLFNKLTCLVSFSLYD